MRRRLLLGRDLQFARARHVRIGWGQLRRVRPGQGRRLRGRQLPMRLGPAVRRRPDLRQRCVRVQPEQLPDRLLLRHRLHRTVAGCLRRRWLGVLPVQLHAGRRVHGRLLQMRQLPGLRQRTALHRRRLRV